MHTRESSATRQATCESKVRAQLGQEGPQRPAREPWVIRCPAPFLDNRVGGLGHRKGWMLLILEGYCRARCYCWVGNAELAKAFGCSASVLGDLLKEMQAAGLIHRAPKEAGRPGRVGIILLTRANADLPTASKAEIPDVIRLMRVTKADQRDKGRGQARLAFPVEDPGPETDHHATGKPVAVPPENRWHHATGKPVAELRSLSLKNDEPENDQPDGGPEGSVFERQRQRPDPPSEPGTHAAEGPPRVRMLALPAPTLPPPAPPLPVVVVEDLPPNPTPVATPPPGPAPGLWGMPTDAERMQRQVESKERQLAALRAYGVRDTRVASAEPTAAPVANERPVAAPRSPTVEAGTQWLDHLTSEGRGRFQAAPEAVKRDLNSLASAGIDDRFLSYAERKLELQASSPPPPPEPETTAELLERLPGAPPNWPQWAAEALARDFGTPKDRKLWEGFLHVTMAVWQGQFPAAALVDAYRQGMNPASKNPGAVFNTALQRDHKWSWQGLKEAMRNGPSFGPRETQNDHA